MLSVTCAAGQEQDPEYWQAAAYDDSTDKAVTAYADHVRKPSACCKICSVLYSSSLKHSQMLLVLLLRQHSWLLTASGMCIILLCSSKAKHQ